MHTRYSCVIAALLGFSAAPAVGANIILEGGFETPSLSGTSLGYCYAQSYYAVSCASEGLQTTNGTFGPWAGNASAAVSRTGTAWGLNGAPADGSQFAVLQSYSSWLQPISINVAGQYILSWSAAGRTNPSGSFGGDQTYVIKIDGVDMATYSTFSGQPFTPHSLLLSLSPGEHALRFSGRVQGSDQSAYIDGVALAPVPEPATASLFAAALAGLFVALTRRQSMLSPGLGDH